MLVDRTSDEVKTKFLAALGLKDTWQEPSWPLPNMKPSTEAEYWGWNASYSWRGEAWLGSKKVGEEWATVRLYFMGHSQFIGGGFAVAIFRSYRKERVEYFTWRACDHVFIEKTVGNCRHLHTCSKCGQSFEIDSSG